MAGPYQSLIQEIEACLVGEWIPDLANTSALIFEHVKDINWVGFYLTRDLESDQNGLVLGPFQGRVACVHIAPQRGVCGHAASLRQTVVVDDVHSFPGHIACDSRSRSEIVVPVLKGPRLLGVLDVDSPSIARFTPDEKAAFETIARLLCEKSGHRHFYETEFS